MLHLDTSILIDALTGPRRSLPALRQIVDDGIRLGLSSIVLYEWRRPGGHALRSRAPHAIAQVDGSGAETSRLKEFEIPSSGGSECRLSAADDHRVEEQVTFVDEIGFERKSCQLGAANEDVVLRFALQLPSRLGIELPLDTRDACRSACQRS